MAGPTPLERWPRDDVGPRLSRGTRKPVAIAWFGFSAFWGHLRHLVASVIATDNIDSRQWMIPEAPDVLLGRVLEIIGPRATRTSAQAMAQHGSLAEAMGGEVWIDFVSDCGDDVTVSEVVARTFAAEYEVDDPDAAETGHAKLVLPRGDILFLGGDLAYPVATVLEMTRRLVKPWNRVLEQHTAGAPRALLAVPGNHDWYDGLDGFARLCQAPCAFEDAPLASDPLHPKPEEHPVLAWAEAFARGDQVKKPTALALAGYLAVQRASYFRFPLAPGLDLFAVDRQLKRVDPRQAAYFAVPGAPARLVVMPDPARAWGEDQLDGKATLQSIGIDMGTSATLLLAGDIHHYERSHEGAAGSIHVVAGGGGAFLHGARIAQPGAYPIEAEFPGPRASWKMLRELPLYCALGRAGWLVPAVFGLGNAIALEEHFRSGPRASAAVALAIGLIVAFGTALLIGWRRHRAARVVPFATSLGLAIGAVPVLAGLAADATSLRVMGWWGSVGAYVLALVLATFASGFAFGVMLMLIARLGLNHAQAYAAMGSAGYKHFVRLRVRSSDQGRSTVDAWVIGIVDPIARPTPVLVDTFRFDPFKER